jgi:hypothetical protein
MALVSLTPFGRGSTSNPTTQIQAIYDALRTLSTAGLDHTNFHPDAGIPEDYIDWDRHKHEDGTLADDCIGMSQLAKTTQVVFTHSPKTLVLFGFTLGVSLAHGDTYYVDFATTSRTKQAFPSGTIPVVFFSRYYTSVRDLEVRFVTTSVTSEGFEIACAEMIDSASAELGYFFYIAIGIAPGILLRSGV